MGFSASGSLCGGRTGWLDAHRRVGTWPSWAACSVDIGQNRGLRWPPEREAVSPARAASSPQAQDLRGALKASHAGSWRGGPGRCGGVRRCAGLAPAFEGFDDDHVSAAARAWRADIGRVGQRIGNGGWCDAELCWCSSDVKPAMRRSWRRGRIDRCCLGSTADTFGAFYLSPFTPLTCVCTICHNTKVFRGQK